MFSLLPSRETYPSCGGLKSAAVSVETLRDAIVSYLHGHMTDYQFHAQFTSLACGYSDGYLKRLCVDYLWSSFEDLSSRILSIVRCEAGQHTKRHVRSRRSRAIKSQLYASDDAACESIVADTLAVIATHVSRCHAALHVVDSKLSVCPCACHQHHQTPEQVSVTVDALSFPNASRGNDKVLADSICTTCTCRGPSSPQRLGSLPHHFLHSWPSRFELALRTSGGTDGESFWAALQAGLLRCLKTVALAYLEDNHTSRGTPPSGTPPRSLSQSSLAVLSGLSTLVVFGGRDLFRATCTAALREAFETVFQRCIEEDGIATAQCAAAVTRATNVLLAKVVNYPLNKASDHSDQVGGDRRGCGCVDDSIKLSGAAAMVCCAISNVTRLHGGKTKSTPASSDASAVRVHTTSSSGTYFNITSSGVESCSCGGGASCPLLAGTITSKLPASLESSVVSLLSSISTSVIVNCRIPHLFDLVAEYPDSVSGLDDLSTALHSARDFCAISERLRAQLFRRLHVGARTVDLLRVFSNALLVSQRLFAGNASLVKFATGAVAEYIKCRKDFVVELVLGTIGHPASDLADILHRELQGVSSGHLATGSDGTGQEIIGGDEEVAHVVASKALAPSPSPCPSQSPSPSPSPVSPAMDEQKIDTAGAVAMESQFSIPLFSAATSLSSPPHSGPSSIPRILHRNRRLQPKEALAKIASPCIGVLSSLVGPLVPVDLFVSTYAIVFGVALLGKIQPDKAKYFVATELLKIRFGDATLVPVSVMHKDLEHSTRLNSTIRACLADDSANWCRVLASRNVTDTTPWSAVPIPSGQRSNPSPDHHTYLPTPTHSRLEQRARGPPSSAADVMIFTGRSSPDVNMTTPSGDTVLVRGNLMVSPPLAPRFSTPGSIRSSPGSPADRDHTSQNFVYYGSDGRLRNATDNGVGIAGGDHNMHASESSNPIFSAGSTRPPRDGASPAPWFDLTLMGRASSSSRDPSPILSETPILSRRVSVSGRPSGAWVPGWTASDGAIEGETTNQLWHNSTARLGGVHQQRARDMSAQNRTGSGVAGGLPLEAHPLLSVPIEVLLVSAHYWPADVIDPSVTPTDVMSTVVLLCLTASQLPHAATVSANATSPPHPFLVTTRDAWERHYRRLKAPRRVNWLESQGYVTLELDFNNKVVELDLRPCVASVLFLFGEVEGSEGLPNVKSDTPAPAPRWSVQAAANALNYSVSVVTAALTELVALGVLVVVMGANSDDPIYGLRRGELYEVVPDVNASLQDESATDSEEDVGIAARLCNDEEVCNVVKGLLANFAKGMTPQSVHRMLGLLLDENAHVLSAELSDIKALLDHLVSTGAALVSGVSYKVVGSVALHARSAQDDDK